jgi:hypothetical protein
MAAALAMAPGAQALDFQVVALSGTTALPFAAGPGTAYAFGLRQPTIADDGWVGIAPGVAGLNASAFMIGVPGQVLAAAQTGQPIDGNAVTTLRALRVDSSRRVSFTASPAGTVALHYGSDDLLAQPAQRLAASGTVYNRPSAPSGPIGFDLLAGGTRLVSAATSTGTAYDAARLDAAGTYLPLVAGNDTASRTLPATGLPGVGTPAAGRLLASAQVVGGNAAGLSFVYGLQVGSGSTIDGAQVRGNLLEVRADGTRQSIVHPGSLVPGVALPSQGINPSLAQFASAGSTLALRADFGRNTTLERKLTGAILRADSGTDAADSRLAVVALPGGAVPGLAGVVFGHKIGVDSGGTLAPWSMLPDNLVLDSARGLTVDAAGRVAFVSAVTAAPAAAGYGVFTSAADGTFRTLALSGTVGGGIAPGSTVAFAKFHDVAVNDAGLVVLSATLAGAGSRQGYWWGRSADDLQLLVVEGQTLEVLPGVFKTVHDLGTGLHALDDWQLTPLDDALGNDGHFAFSVIFTDGSEAVLRTPLAAVPEPGTLALWLAGVAGLACLTRRERRRPGAARPSDCG